MSPEDVAEFEAWWTRLDDEPDEARRILVAYDNGVMLVRKMRAGIASQRDRDWLELWRQRVRARWPDVERDVAKLLES